MLCVASDRVVTPYTTQITTDGLHLHRRVWSLSAHFGSAIILAIFIPLPIISWSAFSYKIYVCVCTLKLQ